MSTNEEHPKQSSSPSGIRVKENHENNIDELINDDTTNKKEDVDSTKNNQDQDYSQTAETLPIDWTNMNQASGPVCRIVFPWDIVNETPYENDEDPSNTEEISIIGTQGQKITKMGSDLSQHYSSTKLKTLVFRSHIIRKIEGLSKLESLEVLELYDNAIDSLDGLNDNGNGIPCNTLRILDMSYNVIRDMEPVQFCPNLVELYLAQNKLKIITGIKHLSKLKKLDLGANRIRVMDINELSGLINLEDLWLGKNKIEMIQGLEKLTKIRRLDIQSNRLTKVENLSSQASTLEELYLAGNGITDEGLSNLNTNGLCNQSFPNLSTLDLSKNKLTTTKFLTTTQDEAKDNFPSLEDLWISGNNISSFEEIRNLSLLGNHLETVYLEFNPIDKDFCYRKSLKEIIPSLVQIDANRIDSLYGSSGDGGSGDGVFSLEERMKEFQRLALEKAKGTK